MDTRSEPSSLATRIARHFQGAASVVAGTIGVLSVAVSPSFSQVVAWENCNLVIPANIDGLYINVETRATGSAGSAVAGWDINPYSATVLTWFNATGTGMMRYPGVTTGSAGNLAEGMLVGPSGSFGSGTVTFGSAAGNWQFNAVNRFGFRFRAADGLTHYGWGTMEVGATATVRTITSIYYQSVAGQPIAVGDVGAYAPCSTANPTLVVGENAVFMNQTTAPSIESPCADGGTMYRANHFKFVAPETGTYGFDPCGHGDDLLFAVVADCVEGASALPGCAGGSESLACGSGCDFPAGAWVELKAGQACYCVVGSASEGASLPSPLPLRVAQETCPCPGDVSGNQQVESVDLAAVLSAWGTSGGGPYDTDVNNDGIVDGNDLAYVLFAWGPCP